MHYDFIPWEWRTDETIVGWERPHPEIVGSIDMRSVPDMSRRGGTPQGFMFAASTDPLPGISTFSIGSRLDQTLNSSQKQSIEAMFGLPTASLRASKTILNLIWDLLTIYGDPTGASRWKALMPTRKGNQEIYLGGHSIIYQEKFEWNGYAGDSVRGVLRHDFARIKRQDRGLLGRRALLKSPGWDHYKRVAGVLEWKYKKPISQILGYDEESLDPFTRLEESFPTDTADLADGSQDLAWTEVDGEWDVTANQVRQVTGAGSDKNARAEADLSSDDHFVEMLVTSLGSGTDSTHIGPAARFAAAAETYYTYFPFQGSDNGFLRKVVGGTETGLANSAITLSIPEIYKVSCDGSTIKGFQAGTERESESDPGGITGNLHGGIEGFHANIAPQSRGDNWVADDEVIAAPAAAAPEGGLNRPYARR